jgi:hypothetical protein
MKFFLGWWIISGSIVEYQVWTFVFGLIFLPSLLACGPNRIVIFKTHLLALLSLSPILLYFIVSNYKIISVLSQTTYPGQRKSEGGLSNAFYWMFTGPFDHSLLNPDSLTGTNHSEFSLGFAIYLIPLIFILLKFSRKVLVRSWEFWSAVSALFFYLWILLPTPTFYLIPFSLIPPQRALTAVSVITPLLFFMCALRLVHENILSKIAPGQKRTALTSQLTLAVFTSFLGLMSYDYFVGFVLPLTYLNAVIISSVVGVSVFYSISLIASKIRLGLYLVAALTTYVGSTINPIGQGLNPYIDNEFASFVKSTSITKSWASDSQQIDAILIANGRTLLSGQQNNGPNFKGWALLDPKGIYKQNWNAGASFVTFLWLRSDEELTITKANPDVIQVISNPCDPKLGSANLNYVASREILSSPCLTKVYESKNRESFVSSEIYIYEIIGSD